MSEYRDEHAARRAEIEMLTQELETRRAELAKAQADHTRLGERVSQLEREQRARQSAVGPRDRTDQVLESIVYVPIATGVSGTLGMIVIGLVLAIPLGLMGLEQKPWFLDVLMGIFVISAVLGGFRTLRNIWRKPNPEKP